MFDIKIGAEVIVTTRGIVEAMEKIYDGRIKYRVKGQGGLLFCIETEIIPVDKKLEKTLKEIV